MNLSTHGKDFIVISETSQIRPAMPKAFVSPSNQRRRRPMESVIRKRFVIIELAHRPRLIPAYAAPPAAPFCRDAILPRAARPQGAVVLFLFFLCVCLCFFVVFLCV